MNGFILVLGVLFFLVEALIEMIEKFRKEFDYKQLLAFAFGAGGAIYFGLDLFAYLDAPSVLDIPGLTLGVNAFFVGVLVARYAGEINGLLEILKGLKDDAQRKINWSG